MKALIATGLIATFALVGCNSPKTTPMQPKPNMQAPHTHSTMPNHGHHAHTHNHTHQHNNVRSFKCDNGAVPTIRVLNDSQIEFTSPLGDAEPTIMDIRPAASGALYVAKKGIYGKGGEWHQKGDMAVFTYHGYGSPTTCTAK